MIHGVSADDVRFRTTTFTNGLNLVLADRTDSAGDKDTTNGLGKSTLIEIIDFCLGSSLRGAGALRSDGIKETKFALDISLKGQRTKVSRSPATASIVVIDGLYDGWPVQPDTQEDGTRTLHIDDWRRVLGWALFSLQARSNGETKYKPTARSMLPYFVRYRPDAFVSPFKHFANQQTWNVQLHNALLLGLDWEKASRWQVLKDQKNALKALRDAIKTGAIEGELSTVGELEAKKARLTEQTTRQRKALEDFDVLEEYREIELEANVLTAQIHQLSNSNLVERRRIEHYQRSLSSEQSPEDDRLDALYHEAGVLLPDSIRRTLEEAKRFNEEIIQNRRQFVSDEIETLERNIEEREVEMSKLSDRRQHLMKILSEHGALDELVKLQERHIGTQQELESVDLRIQQLRQMATRSDEIKVETVGLKKSAVADYEERRQVWTKALNLFATFSDHLYENPGRLVIDIDDTGYKFDVEIEGSPSEGIGKMKIFCYDLALVTFARQRGLGIDFLVHDSTIFDGVDPRQRAHAIELAAIEAEKNGFQYILTLNRDMLPMQDFSKKFDIEKHVRLRLTDTEPTGSLFGFRF